MSTVEQVMNLLIQHPSIPAYPPTLPMSYRCPSCPEADVDGPNSPSHAEHQAHELHKAGLLRPDIEGPRRAVVHPITATTEGTCPGGC